MCGEPYLIFHLEQDEGAFLLANVHMGQLDLHVFNLTI
jgi:hypothetical protein